MKRSSLRNKPGHNPKIGGLGDEGPAKEPEKGAAARSGDHRVSCPGSQVKLVEILEEE